MKEYTRWQGFFSDQPDKRPKKARTNRHGKLKGVYENPADRPGDISPGIAAVSET